MSDTTKKNNILLYKPVKQASLHSRAVRTDGIPLKLPTFGAVKDRVRQKKVRNAERLDIPASNNKWQQKNTLLAKGLSLPVVA